MQTPYGAEASVLHAYALELPSSMASVPTCAQTSTAMRSLSRSLLSLCKAMSYLNSVSLVFKNRIVGRDRKPHYIPNATSCSHFQTLLILKMTLWIHPREDSLSVVRKFRSDKRSTDGNTDLHRLEQTSPSLSTEAKQWKANTSPVRLRSRPRQPWNS